MDYELIRSKRRTIAIHIKDCRVIVRAPLRAPVREINRFVASKEQWIQKHITEQYKRNAARVGYVLDYGSPVLYLGQEYRIASASDKDDKDFIYFPPGLSETKLQKKLIDFYKKQAEEYIADRIHYYVKQIGIKPTDIRIGSAKKSWGSCTTSGKLTFSWRLMMASPEAIDYVVVHELAHLKQLNHSNKFWTIVEKLIPDWKKHRKELHILQKRLANENWQ